MSKEKPLLIKQLHCKECDGQSGIKAAESHFILLTDPQVNVLLLTGRRPPIGNRHVLGIVGGAAVQEQDPPGAVLLLQPVQLHFYLKACHPIKRQHSRSHDIPLFGELVTSVCVY